MPGPKILVVEDDPVTSQQVRQTLETEGFQIRLARDGAGALHEIHDFQPELVILDIDLPRPSEGERLDGLRVLEALRQDTQVPVLMLTVTSAISVKVFALTIGADDYLTKPFDSRELIARVRALLRRRGRPGREGVLDFGRLRIDTGARRVWKDGREIALTPLEFELLRTLAGRPGWAFDRSQLIRGAWGFDRYGDIRVVDTHIGHLRKKIEDDPARPGFILTVRGVGYRFQDEPISPPDQGV